MSDSFGSWDGARGVLHSEGTPPRASRHRGQPPLRVRTTTERGTTDAGPVGRGQRRVRPRRLAAVSEEPEEPEEPEPVAAPEPTAAPAATRTPTFDEELLLWLEDEPPRVRAADSERIRDIADEFAHGFDALAAAPRRVGGPAGVAARAPAGGGARRRRGPRDAARGRRAAGGVRDRRRGAPAPARARPPAVAAHRGWLRGRRLAAHATLRPAPERAPRRPGPAASDLLRAPSRSRRTGTPRRRCRSPCSSRGRRRTARRRRRA